MQTLWYQEFSLIIDSYLEDVIEQMYLCHHTKYYHIKIIVRSQSKPFIICGKGEDISQRAYFTFWSFEDLVQG